MGLLKIAHVPPPMVGLEASVAQAVDLMAQHRVGAVVVVDKGALRGIFTERDLMMRVVREKRDPETTLVPTVMTSDVKTVSRACPPEDAIGVMLAGHLRHLPVLGGDGTVLGVLSIRALLENKVDDLHREVSSLEQYISNDSPGG